MKKVKIITIILAIVLVSLVAFGGVYIQTQNRMEDKVKEYSLGRELNGERVVEIKVTDGSKEGKTKPSDEELTVENYETVKKTVENRLKDLGAQDYTISLDKENGTIRVELPENSNTDTYVYYLTASGKVEMKEKDTENVLLNDSMIKKAQYTYTSNADGAYQVYLELILTKDGQAKLDEVKNDYAVLATEVSEAESKNNTTSDNTTTESSTDEDNTTTNTTTEGTETQKSELLLLSVHPHHIPSHILPDEVPRDPHGSYVWSSSHGSHCSAVHRSLPDAPSHVHTSSSYIPGPALKVLQDPQNKERAVLSSLLLN